MSPELESTALRDGFSGQVRMKAYEVRFSGYPGVCQIVAAQSRNRARFDQYLAMSDTGYTVSYLDVRAVRASAYDKEASVYNGKFGSVVLGWEIPGEEDKAPEKWGVLRKEFP